MTKPNGATVFALKAYSVKRIADRFYIAPTAAFTDKQRWGKSYATLQAATAAIARQLAEEWLQRNTRHEKFHRRVRRMR